MPFIKKHINQATAEMRNSKKSYEQNLAFNIKHDNKSCYVCVRSKQKVHLADFLVKNKLINSSQYGFLKAMSRLTNISNFLEGVTKWVDEGSPVDIIYLYLKKKPLIKCYIKDYYLN